MGKVKLFLGTVLLSLAMFSAPLSASADTFYTVNPGDTLWAISQSYNTSVEQIQALNNLNSSLIFPGQSLIIANNTDTNQNVPPITLVSRGSSRAGTILDYAKSFIGVPYRYGGTTPKGFDCSGYVQYVFGNFGIDLPRTAVEQYNFGWGINAKDARPGDIVAFRAGGTISHTGIYLGGSNFISSTSSSGVMIASINGPYWGDHFFGFSRVMP
ncbi:MAG: Murein DD-endopeptidase MepS/Murein LD-carboxypeptidase precursor [Pelotomaculum sp. PtaB.Bin104]|nr:MAG: Murein DD-endopeptidase MepS/Murein LD-carboxypeptidase precursor [Pelotomaculum sp. PtaB.Bin104]